MASFFPVFCRVIIQLHYFVVGWVASHGWLAHLLHKLCHRKNKSMTEIEISHQDQEIQTQAALSQCFNLGKSQVFKRHGLHSMHHGLSNLHCSNFWPQWYRFEVLLPFGQCFVVGIMFQLVKSQQRMWKETWTIEPFCCISIQQRKLVSLCLPLTLLLSHDSCGDSTMWI